MERTLIVCPCARSTWSFRKGQIRALQERGHQVHVATPTGPWAEKLIELGAVHHAVDFARYSNPLQDAKTLLRLARLMRRIQPSTVYLLNVKAVVLGGFAARLSGSPRVVTMVPGAGYAFLQTDEKTKTIPAGMVIRCLKQVNRGVDRILFLNRDDAEMYQRLSLARPEQARVIISEGVCTSEYSPESVSPQVRQSVRHELGVPDGEPLVLMMGRATWSKGTRLFVEASKDCSEWGCRPHFRLAGARESDCPDPVDEDYLADTETFRWLGWRSDVKALLAAADIVTLPSYREGTPRTMLEALAMGKPVVTTDAIGCREVVRDGWNGYQTPVGDASAFAQAVRRLVESPQDRARFGERSRRWAQSDFEESFVSERIVSALFDTAAEPLRAAA